jgi:hypothetical protein
MPDIVSPSGIDALKEKLQDIAGSSARVAPQLSDAILDVLTALDYADESLLASSCNSLLSCLVVVARDIIQREVKASEDTREGIKKAWREHVDGVACENFDEIKNVIESIIDERIASMTKIRDKLVKPLEEKEYQVENSQQLEDGIREVRRFRETILKDWPSLNKRVSSINRQAVAEAREASARGNKGMRKDELIWGRTPSDEKS